MKQLLFIFIFTLGLCGYSQEKSLDTLSNVDITQAERIIDKYAGKISDAFNEGLEKVTPVAEEGFKIAVKLQIAKGIVGLFPFIFAIVFVIIFFNQMKLAIKLDENKESSDLQAGMMVLSGILGALCIIVTFFTLGDAIQRLIAPEWFAIKEIIGLF